MLLPCRFFTAGWWLPLDVWLHLSPQFARRTNDSIVYAGWDYLHCVQILIISNWMSPTPYNPIPSEFIWTKAARNRPERMSVVAGRPPESRMSYNRPPSYRDGSPHRQPPSPTYPRVMVPPISPRSSSFSYTNYHFANSNAPNIYSPTAAQFPFRSAGRSPVFPDTPSPTFPKQLPQEGVGENSTHETKIHIHGIDSPAQLKKYKWKRGSRLKLLRRTLRERKLLANAVLELRVPELDLSISTGKHHAGLQEYVDLIASVVMACPNLERLLGITLPYTHEFDRLTHALSTRKKLKEHAWIIGENVAVSERAIEQAPKLLDQGQVYQFLSFHTFWGNLETLMLHSLDSNGILEHGIVLRMLNFLPALRHLSVSSFNANDFTDRTLLFLPALTSLRLESLPGITENGLARYISRQEARGLQSLTLIEQNITSLLVVSKILASLRHLQRFAIVQRDTAPILPEGRMVFQPLLASSSLKYLHWDLASPNPDALNQLEPQQLRKASKGANTPNFHLAQSILHAGFPSLETLRAPSDIDPLGALQAVCRPTRNGQIMLISDRYSLPRSSQGTLSKRPLAMPSGNNLTSARIRAQTLIDTSAREGDQGIKVVVTDHSADIALPLPAFSDSSSENSFDEFDNMLESIKKRKQNSSPPQPPSTPAAITVQEFIIPTYIGRVYNSAYNKMAPTTPRFNLKPDIPNSDADGGLISWKHILTANQTWSYYTPSSPSLSVIRAGTNSSLGDDIPSPSPTSSRHTIRSPGAGSSGGSLPSPRTPTSPIPPLSPLGVGPGEQPQWARETCNGSWNQGHRQAKDWWMHVEREKIGLGGPMNPKLMELKHLF
ncbi:predicted protein [Uncinocarpus reesii 1704]|uniref:Uncharacterized protein n=1 Tax=Uncinocarpus reesii (strain UAMH 1704) TaxID=336963 RepID=C4JYT0_UNCRE|nr:uncharacterized protein UREG_07331 [Uncinocarpus reesii 1704]EEP82466.1 predicted protein [Uncinocarpus reesii 1704]